MARVVDGIAADIVPADAYIVLLLLRIKLISMISADRVDERSAIL